MSDTNWRSALFALPVLLAGVLLCQTARAADPQLNALQPHAFQRGTEIEVQFRGNNLADIEQIVFYSPGFTVEELSGEGNVARATVRIADDCRLGFHVVRARTATGMSNMAVFFVGALPQIEEEEPNNDFYEPQPIPMNTAVLGVITQEDVDYFVVEAKQGERISAEVEGLRYGRAYFDPYIAIYNSDRFALARNDDTALLRHDSICQIIAPEDGRYIIEVRETAYGGNNNSVYRLHVGNFPRPLAVTPSGARPGETVEFTWLGDVRGPWTEAITIPDDARDSYELFPQTEEGISPSPITIRISDLPNVNEVEPNDSRQQATPLESPPAAPVAFNGVISEPGDVDHFRFTANKDEQYDIRVYARDVLRSPLDSVLAVLNSEGRALESNDDSGGPDSRLTFRVPEDGEYVLRIRDHLDNGGPEYAYRIEVAPVAPSLALTLPERRQYFSQTLEVPRGNRMALMVNARRENFSGELKVEIPDLPAGITAEIPPMAADQNQTPMLFTAESGAEPAGTLTEMIAIPADENISVRGGLQQRTMLVRGQNNRDVWGHDGDRLAASVIDEAPFTLRLVQPQVPIVRDGSMDLKVVAERKEGYTAPIKVDMLYTPPGIGASGGVSIAEGENEALIPLTANSGATLRTWPIAVIGRGPVPGGNLEVSTEFAELEVADNHFTFGFPKVAVEQGREVDVMLEIAKKRDWEGPAVLQLLGLPAGATAEPVEITSEDDAAVFRVKTSEETRDGRHTSIVCRAVITKHDEPITLTLGNVELRVDKPLPAPVAAAEQPEAETPAEPEAPPERPLSRLEQLRQQREAAGN